MFVKIPKIIISVQKNVKRCGYMKKHEFNKLGEPKAIKGKFQICLIIREYIDTGERVEMQSLTDYAESCYGWEDVKKALDFFIKRTEEKLNGIL